MGLLDDVTKAISDKSNDALLRSKEKSDISRYNAIISEETAILNNNYFQIGKLYTQLHSNDCENCFKSYIEAINLSSKKIAECERTLKAMKGIMDCPFCGTQIPLNAVFCNACGKQIPPPPSVDITKNTRCAACGTYVPNEMRFCIKCGRPMPAKQTEPEAQPSQQFESASGLEAQTLTCAKCGYQLDSDSVFCPACGNKV